MKILVPVKRVIDYNVRVRVKSDGSGVEKDSVKHSINPFDEIAVEEAVKLKEKGIAKEVVAVSIGEQNVQEALRHALALGADSAIHVVTADVIQPLAAAKILRSIFVSEAAQLIIMGKQAIDDDCNQTGQMLAALLNTGQATFASELQFDGDTLTVTREVDGGLAKVKLQLPAVVTTDLRLNTPRYATLPNIMKAKSKPIKSIPVESLNEDIAPRLQTLNVAAPPPRKPGVKVASVAELVGKLKSAGVLA